MSRRFAWLMVVMLGVLAGLTLAPRSAQAWWNDDWQLRKQLTVDTGPTGAGIADPIGTTPMLVRLHSGNFQFEVAKDDGTDLRFVADDDVTPLKYHIEKYDPLLGEAFVWVAVPDLKPGTQTKIWLYYGNAKAAVADDAKGTYDPATLLVYHFAERGVPARDHTSWGNGARTAGVTGEGSMIGPGLRLDGLSTVTLPDSASLRWANGAAMTWTAWLKPAALQPNAVIFGRRDGVAGLTIGLDNGVPFVALRNAFGTQRAVAAGVVAPGTWHHLAVVSDGQQTRLYLDGAAAGSVPAGLAAMTTAAILGGEPPAEAPPSPETISPQAPADAPPVDAPPAEAAPAEAPPAELLAPLPASAPAVNFVGELDELTIAGTARPAGFIKAAAVGQGADNGKFLSFSVDEEAATWLTGYFAVIVRSVTLDAWVVIGILGLMAIISWIVVAEKLSYVNRQSRANRAFLERFDVVASDLTILDRGDADHVSTMGGRMTDAEVRMMRNSSLYRVYHAGAHEIRRRFVDNHIGPKFLPAESIAAIRASLDSAQVRETQKLNALVVVLTIAISGGPFLGLLGTVVGVMITFAAIAASGDVNVNAIAPGIAAALLATVAGLGVAIPALFAYNYLNTRIKDAVSDIQIFVDEFVTRMAEFYAWRPDEPRPARSDARAAE